MKAKHYLPLLFLSILFNSCIEKTITRKDQTTTPPEFTIDRENLKSRIAKIIPSDNIHISSGTTQTSGEAEYKFLTVEIENPSSFPTGGFSFSAMANEIAEVVEKGIENINDYKKINIEVRNTVEEINTEHTRTYKKEIDI